MEKFVFDEVFNGTYEGADIRITYDPGTHAYAYRIVVKLTRENQEGYVSVQHALNAAITHINSLKGMK